MEPILEFPPALHHRDCREAFRTAIRLPRHATLHRPLSPMSSSLPHDDKTMRRIHRSAPTAKRAGPRSSSSTVSIRHLHDPDVTRLPVALPPRRSVGLSWSKRNHGAPMYKHLLVATDGSRISAKAVTHAI